jgi:hypothetical protein
MWRTFMWGNLQDDFVTRMSRDMQQQAGPVCMGLWIVLGMLPTSLLIDGADECV